MHTENILKYLSDRGIKADCSMDRRNTLSSKLVRCVYEGTPLMAVGGDQEKNRQVTGAGVKCIEEFKRGNIADCLKHNRACLLKERDILFKRGFVDPNKIEFHDLANL